MAGVRFWDAVDEFTEDELDAAGAKAFLRGESEISGIGGVQELLFGMNECDLLVLQQEGQSAGCGGW